MEQVKELLYDIQRAKSDEEIHDLVMKYKSDNNESRENDQENQEILQVLADEIGKLTTLYIRPGSLAFRKIYDCLYKLGAIT